MFWWGDGIGIIMVIDVLICLLENLGIKVK